MRIDWFSAIWWHVYECLCLCVHIHTYMMTISVTHTHTHTMDWLSKFTECCRLTSHSHLNLIQFSIALFPWEIFLGSELTISFMSLNRLSMDYSWKWNNNPPPTKIVFFSFFFSELLENVLMNVFLVSPVMRERQHISFPVWKLYYPEDWS